MMEKDRWLIYIERNCEHGRMLPHRVIFLKGEKGSLDCDGGDRIQIGGFTMPEEAVYQWMKAAPSVD